MRHFFDKLGQNMLRSFWGYAFFAHAAAILLTYILVVSGFDWFYFTHAQIPLLQSLLFPAVIIGFFLPMTLPFILLGIGKVKAHIKIQYVAFALGQAGFIGLVISSFYKSLTGRLPPRVAQAAIDTIDTSRNFNFGFWQNGVFWGWPSTHTTVAFAVATALMMMYPKNKVVWVLAILYAFYIGFGVTMRIHWFSEFVAGALIGTVIGVIVGKSFYKKLSAV